MTVLSFASAQEVRRRIKAIAAHVPHCGPCYAAGDFNELVPIKLWATDGSPVAGFYCAQCGEEFHQ